MHWQTTAVQKNEELELEEAERKRKEESERDKDTKMHEDWFKQMDDILFIAGRAKEQLREVAASPLHPAFLFKIKTILDGVPKL